MEQFGQYDGYELTCTGEYRIDVYHIPCATTVLTTDQGYGSMFVRTMATHLGVCSAINTVGRHAARP